tara:strand:+ start:11476 stop:12498 length:1023 start_codon:yes stop_codon:yes gene_type:complete
MEAVLKFCFAGFGHVHIYSLLEHVQTRQDLEFVGACEGDPELAVKAGDRGVEVSYKNLEDALNDVEVDVVAIGAPFGLRGRLALEALAAGKHVISDKPLCTSLEELREIEQLSRSNDLRLGCMLTMRDNPEMQSLRTYLKEGLIGEVHAIQFGGQHPLNAATRPQWYFEPGMHGGTINDIFVHAADAIPWMTGLDWVSCLSARCWNASCLDVPHFEDGAQMMLKMNNGCGVLGDVSYLMPSTGAYTLPYYWRMTMFGQEGVVEVTEGNRSLTVTREGEIVPLQSVESDERGYLDGFVNDVRGESAEDDLTTEGVIRAMDVALTIQQAADYGRHGVSLTAD